MYLIVFVTLAVALIGAYAQIYVKQATNTIAQAAPVVTSLLEWHNTAWALASHFIEPLKPNNECLLAEQSSKQGHPTGISTCKDKNNNDAIVGGTKGSAYLCGDGTNPTPDYCYTELPEKNNDASYTYYSIPYNIGGIQYVLTYIPPTLGLVDKYDLVCVPGYVKAITNPTVVCPRRLPITYMELYRQLGRTQILASVSYGVVKDTDADCPTGKKPCLVSAADKNVTYPVPTKNVPAESIGIIGIANYCKDCEK